MVPWLQLIKFALQACPVCGSYFVRQSLLCSPCEKYLLSMANPHVEKLGPWTLRYLFEWNAGESDALSALLVGLKGPHRTHAWSFWAKVFLRLHQETLPRHSMNLLSAPLRPGQCRDHASDWASALANETGLRHWGSCFQKAQPTQRRFLSREERQKVDKLVKITERELPSEEPWVLADDILTTGGTALGVHRSLGRPLEYEIWCLARRKNERSFQSGEGLL